MWGTVSDDDFEMKKVNISSHAQFTNLDLERAWAEIQAMQYLKLMTNIKWTFLNYLHFFQFYLFC